MSALSMIEEAAARLRQAAEFHTPCEPVRYLLGESDVASAYAVQTLLAEGWSAQGRRLVGRKIGLTAPSVQRQLGVDQPDYGLLYDDMDIVNGGEILFGAVLQPRCEAEIAFVLKADLTQERLTTADVLAAIDYAVPSLEVVGSRIQGWNIKITDTIADNASSGLFVLGHDVKRLGAFDPVHCGMALRRNGELVSTGAGAACLGSPINALLWLAKTMAKTRYPLRAGDVVLSGALGPMVDARPGDAFEAEIQGLGSVSVTFAEAFA